MFFSARFCDSRFSKAHSSLPVAVASSFFTENLERNHANFSSKIIPKITKAVVDCEVIFGFLIISAHLARIGLLGIFWKKFSTPNFFEPIVKILLLVFHTRMTGALEVMRKISMDMSLSCRFLTLNFS